MAVSRISPGVDAASRVWPVTTEMADAFAAPAAEEPAAAAPEKVLVGAGVGALAGGLILGIAMLRQGGAIPAWAGWALIASEPVRVVGLVAGIPFGPPAASVLIAAAFAGTLMAARSRKG